MHELDALRGICPPPGPAFSLLACLPLVFESVTTRTHIHNQGTYERYTSRSWGWVATSDIFREVCVLALGRIMVGIGLLCAVATFVSAPPMVPRLAQHQHSREATMTVSTRRQQLGLALGAALTLPTFNRARPANAADAVVRKWISGRSDPIRPTSKDKPDGTKKDNRYLGCLNDCVPRKQGIQGQNQLERLDALEACQQECCFTYEQCTYTIRK
jgi:hypothetical protein